MRRAIFRRPRILLKASTSGPILRPIWTSKRETLRPQAPRKRSLSSPAVVSAPESSECISESSSSPEDEPPQGTPSIPPEQPPEEPELPRTRATRKEPPPPENPEIPDDILWLPSQADSEPSGALPPPEILEEALNNLHVTLHPQTQHRATYASVHGQPIEPTLALYSPIEGGDYVIDATVMELARRTNAEILVLDAVQLAAGEWGSFGKAANVIQLPRNPLHFSSSSSSSDGSSSSSHEEQMEEDEDEPPTRQVTFTLMSPPSSFNLGTPTTMVSTKRTSSVSNKIKVFFDAVVGLVSKSEPPSPRYTPRLVYIRDFPTLAPSCSTWYPHLLAAVRQRRRGALSRPSSPVNNPMTIIFGITPSLTSSSSSSGPSSNLVNLLMNRMQSPQLVITPRSNKLDWGEGEAADSAREKRLRHRLKKWEKGDAALLEDLPKLSPTEDSDNHRPRPEVLFMGMAGLVPNMLSNSNRSSSEAEANSNFFRTSILVPGTRSPAQERECRVSRRREINELTMRMAIGGVGGVIDGPYSIPETSPTAVEEDVESDEQLAESEQLVESEEQPVESGETAVEEPEDIAADPKPEAAVDNMWDSWGEKIEVWSNVKQIADHAVGSVVAGQGSLPGKGSLEPTVVPWSAVQHSWAAHRSIHELRKQWMKVTLPGKQRDQSEEPPAPPNVDEVVERLKTDGELDSHEQRLLSCIVDPATMPTSFSRVHLPPHTIDSVRTIVSLPLLYPEAFKSGILKEHSMTGCLLFGPPGVGKTLVVRALAKEAGCRMMVVTPADVMDMYVGEGEKLVKAVFSLARKLSPCVVFLDEIDALFGARMSSRDNGGAVAHRGVITEFMQEMDGLKSTRDDNVIVIGATNRPFDLDDAVLRRLPRRLLVDLPGVKEREEILKIHLRDENLAPDVNVKALAAKSETFSGSDLKHLCVAAALHAVKEKVKLPWATPNNPNPSSTTVDPLIPTYDSLVEKALVTEELDPIIPETDEEDAAVVRILSLRNFDQAFKEITPSSSETLGTLSQLRKWNEEFGEGRNEKRRRVIWGKGKFGFSDKALVPEEDGHVMSPASQTISSTSI
ncbi:hypothetical protein C8J56DRAFT_831682 [Mycena floridula]|nr:hypothetical protein C8J56DRAFT_831682 [Mycena floridula]